MRVRPLPVDAGMGRVVQVPVAAGVEQPCVQIGHGMAQPPHPAPPQLQKAPHALRLVHDGKGLERVGGVGGIVLDGGQPGGDFVAVVRFALVVEGIHTAHLLALHAHQFGRQRTRCVKGGLQPAQHALIERQCTQHQRAQPQAPFLSKRDQPGRERRQDAGKGVVAHHAHQRAQRRKARDKPRPAQERRVLQQAMETNQKQHQQRHKIAVLGVADGEHGMHRKQREQRQRRPENRPGRSDAPQMAHGRSKGRRHERHLHQDEQRIAPCRVAHALPQAVKSAKDQRVQKGIAVGVLAGKNLVQLGIDIIGRYARPVGQQNRQPAYEDQRGAAPHDPPCAPPPVSGPHGQGAQSAPRRGQHAARRRTRARSRAQAHKQPDHTRVTGHPSLSPSACAPAISAPSAMKQRLSRRSGRARHRPPSAVSAAKAATHKKRYPASRPPPKSAARQPTQTAAGQTCRHPPATRVVHGVAPPLRIILAGDSIPCAPAAAQADLPLLAPPSCPCYNIG